MQLRSLFQRKITLFALAAAAALVLSSIASAADAGDNSPASAPAFVHPGLLHAEKDFARVRQELARGAEPWKSGWQRLIANPHASLGWKPRPASIVFRGNAKGHSQNYAVLFNDIAAAYACALRWRISGDRAYGDKAVQIMNAWSSILTRIDGTSDRFLAAGIYGYEFANAAEIMRTYDGWAPADFKQFQAMMLKMFYSENHDFLLHHNGAKIDHYWCNWDACNMASILAIGVLCDDRSLYNEAVDYFKHGRGNGAIQQAVYFMHPGHLGQWQESGRDQGHSTLGIALLGAFCQMAWTQGDDLYGYDNNRFLAGAEYVAKYNLGHDVPYKPYANSDVRQPMISPGGRGDLRPTWEMIYNHYAIERGMDAPYSAQFAEKVRPEGGGGDYGPNSGGYDQLGYGTLMFTLPPSTANRSSHHPEQ